MGIIGQSKGNIQQLSAKNTPEKNPATPPHLFFAVCFALVSAALPAAAEDFPVPPIQPVIEPFTIDLGMGNHMDHGQIPAGVHGAGLVPAGGFYLSYTPEFMHMDENYIGSSIVSPQTIVTTIPSNMTMTMPGMMGMTMCENYRIVPTFMNVQMHMMHAMYGITDTLNVMVMSSYQQKSMTMITFAGAKGINILGSSSGTTEGFGDTMVSVLWRLYRDPIRNFISISASACRQAARRRASPCSARWAPI